MKIIRRNQHLEMPWSNSKGVTQQIAIYPKNASLASQNFDWRLSAAQIDADNQFSKFSGFHRYLAIIDGDPVLLNHEKLELFQVLKFSGDQPIFCKRTSRKSVLDIGLIYNPNKLNPSFEVLDSNSKGFQKEIIICARGVARIGSESVQTLDVAILDRDTIIECETADARFIRISGLAL